MSKWHKFITTMSGKLKHFCGICNVCSIFELATPLAPGSFLLLASLGNLTKASQTWCYVVSITSDVVSFCGYTLACLTAFLHKSTAACMSGLYLSSSHFVLFIFCYSGAGLNKMV